MKIILILTLLFFSCTGFSQSIDSVEYKVNGESHTAYYALPNAVGPRTVTVLIVHEWWGLNEYPKERAIQLAKDGYIAFCVDMYGTGKVVHTPAEAMLLSNPFYKDSEMAYQTFMAGYDEAVKIEGVNKDKMAAIGYCYGGAMVLNAAKSGAPLDAVVSFHGGLSGIPVDAEKLKAAVLVCNGAADKFVPQSDIDTLQKQMNEANADYTFINYADATHAFTNPHSTEVGKKYGIPIAYNEAADKKSWEDFQRFLRKKVY